MLMEINSAEQRPRFSLQILLPNLVAGVVLGALEISIIVSCTAMIFSGQISGYLPQGVGIILFGTLILSLVVAALSSFVPSIAVPQDVPMAILAVITTTVTREMIGHAPPSIIFLTVVATMILTTMITGVAFWLMGHFKLGGLVRFIPFPVVGGFLSGTGCFLILGGVGVMANVPPSLALLQPELLIRWLPGVIFGALLYILLRRHSHYLLMPGIMLGGLILFYLIYFLSAGSIASAVSENWLLGPFPQGGLFNFLTIQAFSQADWSYIFKHIINLSTIIIVSTISLLLNASGLEISSGADIDLNYELKATGLANLLAGFGGSPVGFHSLSSSMLARRLGAKDRLGSLTFSAMVAIAILFGATALAVLPKMIAGGLLIFLGLSFLIEFVYDTWYKLSKPEYLLIWLILIIIVTVGILEGVAVGILVATILFVLNYSRINVIHHTVNGANYQSHVMRPRLYQQLLRQRGDILYILKLQGFIFFGTATSLVANVRDRLEDPDLARLQYLLLDFQLVTGIDSSAALSFSKLKQLVENQGITLVFTGLSPKIQTQLEREVYKNESEDDLRIFPDLDQGVAWCEDKLINVFSEVGLVAKPKTALQLIGESLSPSGVERDWLSMITPDIKAKPSSSTSRMLEYLKYIETIEGDCFIEEGDEIQGMYFIEDGQFISIPSVRDPEGKLRVTLEAGTVFGEIGYYTEQRAIATLICSRPGKLLYLSCENMERMETEDPELAIAFHRIVAANMGNKLALSSNMIRALRD